MRRVIVRYKVKPELVTGIPRKCLRWNAVCDFEIPIVHDDGEAQAIVKKNLAEG